MIPLLPKWYLNHNRPTFYDTDSGTMLELAGNMYGKMNEIIADYNEFVDDTNRTVTEKLTEYEQSINEGRRALRQEFQDFIDIVDMKINKLETNYSTETIEELLDLAKEINGD